MTGSLGWCRRHAAHINPQSNGSSLPKSNFLSLSKSNNSSFPSHHGQPHCIYILLRSSATFHSVSFSKPTLVWFGTVTPQKLLTIFQTNSSLVWKEKKMILQDADSKPNSDWFGKFWWSLSMSWKFQTKFSLVWKNHWLLPMSWTLNQFQFYYVKSHFRKGKHSNMQVQD